MIVTEQLDFASEVLESDRPVLVDFKTDWCGPCKALAPTVKELAKEYAGRVEVVTVDADKHADLAAEHGVRALPTLLLFRDGQVVDRAIGHHTKADLAAKLEAALR